MLESAFAWGIHESIWPCVLQMFHPPKISLLCQPPALQVGQAVCLAAEPPWAEAGCDRADAVLRRLQLWSIGSDRDPAHFHCLHRHQLHPKQAIAKTEDAMILWINNHNNIEECIFFFIILNFTLPVFINTNVYHQMEKRISSVFPPFCIYCWLRASGVSLLCFLNSSPI